MGWSQSAGDSPLRTCVPRSLMAWMYLLIAAVFEVGLKCARGFTELWPGLLTIVAMGLSLVFGLKLTAS